MFICWFGILIIIFGLINLYTVYKTDEDDLPAPKEYLYKSCLVIILIGLLIYESGKLGKRLSDYTNQPVQNYIKIY